MKFSHRGTTKSRAVITRSLWIRAKSQFLHNISDKVLLYNIPDKLIINADQIPSTVAIDNVKMAAKGEKCISPPVSTDRNITLTICESHSGTILPFQLIYIKKNDKIAAKC